MSIDHTADRLTAKGNEWMERWMDIVVSPENLNCPEEQNNLSVTLKSSLFLLLLDCHSVIAGSHFLKPRISPCERLAKYCGIGAVSWD